MIVAPVCVGSIRSVCNDVRPPRRMAKSHSTSWMAVYTSSWEDEAVLPLTGTEAAVDFGLKACILRVDILSAMELKQDGVNIYVGDMMEQSWSSQFVQSDIGCEDSLIYLVGALQGPRKEVLSESVRAKRRRYSFLLQKCKCEYLPVESVPLGDARWAVLIVYVTVQPSSVCDTADGNIPCASM
jgi:hypothetical protein